METPDRIPFPDKIVGWFDILRGVGETALLFITDRHHHEPVDEFDRSSWSPVQQEAARWGEIGNNGTTNLAE